MELYWVRACSRGTPAELVLLLRQGDEPPPPGTVTGTKQLELELEIAPARVYFYLGRTHAGFGTLAFAVRQRSCSSSEVSPCDTGGLVKHIKPVSAWEPEAKKSYLSSVTWSHDELVDLLTNYPGPTVAHVKRYLDLRQKPVQEGPHAVWPTRAIEAPIWSQNDDWRAWTWEARASAQVPMGDNLVAWSCAPALRESVMDAIAYQAQTEAVDGKPPVWALRLVDTYIDGGVGLLVDTLKHVQVAA